MRRLFFLPLVALAACSTEPPAPVSGLKVPEGPCGHALVVLSTDSMYAASSVGVVGFDGKVLAPSILSDASTTTGLSAPLGGDVVLPTMPTPGEIVTIARGGNGVITWFDPPSGKVSRHQLEVGARTNPHDYLELSSTKAYVSRYDARDVVVLDLSKLEIVSTLKLDKQFSSLPAGISPHPGRMVKTSSDVVLLVTSYSTDYLQDGDNALVRIDPASDTVKSIVPLPGLHGCNALALAPSGKEIAVGCSGAFAGTSNPTLSDAGVIVFDASSFMPLRSWRASDLTNRWPGFSIAFASDDLLFVPAIGSVDKGTSDNLLTVEVGSSLVSVADTASAAFDLGEVRCAPSCGACFVTYGSTTDASVNRVKRYAIDSNAAVTGITGIQIGDGARAPRYLGVY